jgi:hypothetical protein
MRYSVLVQRFDRQIEPARTSGQTQGSKIGQQANVADG